MAKTNTYGKYQFLLPLIKYIYILYRALADMF